MKNYNFPLTLSFLKKQKNKYEKTENLVLAQHTAT